MRRRQMKGCLLVFSLLVLVATGTAEAQSTSYWSAEVSFTVNVTNWDTQDGVVLYFNKYSPTLSGTWYVDYTQQLDPVKVGSKLESLPLCYAGFISYDGANEIWIYDGNYIWTSNPNSKSEKFLFIGTGIFVDHDAKTTAAAYIDASGTHKRHKLGYIESIKMKGKIGAGMQPNETYPWGFFVLSGQFNVTLY